MLTLTLTVSMNLSANFRLFSSKFTRDFREKKISELCSNLVGCKLFSFCDYFFILHIYLKKFSKSCHGSCTSMYGTVQSYAWEWHEIIIWTHTPIWNARLPWIYFDFAIASNSSVMTIWCAFISSHIHSTPTFVSPNFFNIQKRLVFINQMTTKLYAYCLICLSFDLIDKFLQRVREKV